MGGGCRRLYEKAEMEVAVEVEVEVEAVWRCGGGERREKRREGQGNGRVGKERGRRGKGREEKGIVKGGAGRGSSYQSRYYYRVRD